jgi:hypothetical protein
MISSLTLFRAAAVGLAAVVLLINYLIDGGLDPGAIVLGSGLALGSVAVFWLVVELDSARGVGVREAGVAFRYPLRERFVPWTRLSKSSHAEPSWIDSVSFLERNDRGRLVRAHRVTRDEAVTIEARMPAGSREP